MDTLKSAIESLRDGAREAQGEWLAVDVAYAPAWAACFKQAVDAFDDALEALAASPAEKTRAEIDALKANWTQDPCWDIEDTEGFEAHRVELLEFHLQAERRDHAKLAEAYFATAEGRLEILERRVQQLERKFEAQQTDHR